MRQALSGMLWSKQFFFFDVTIGWMNTIPIRFILVITMPELRVVPHAEQGHHLDARQVGVPLVRSLGSCLPHDRSLDR